MLCSDLVTRQTDRSLLYCVLADWFAGRYRRTCGAGKRCSSVAITMLIVLYLRANLRGVAPLVLNMLPTCGSTCGIVGGDNLRPTARDDRNGFRISSQCSSSYLFICHMTATPRYSCLAACASAEAHA